MSKFDEQYIDLCRRILKEGEKITNYKKADKRSAKVAQAIPDHTAQGASEARTIRLPHQVLQFDLSHIGLTIKLEFAFCIWFEVEVKAHWFLYSYSI